ncbi:MAG TPA: S8 family serine peptidase [Nevskiaceae bacterium]|nr:S8 family serine peptidase [Nevskiaceae bacterium]
MKLKSGLIGLGAAALAAGCGMSLPGAVDKNATDEGMGVPVAAKALDSCDSSYADDTKALRPVDIDPAITYGAPARLILSFHSHAQSKSAMALLSSLTAVAGNELGLKLVAERNLFGFRVLPMLWIGVPAASEQLVQALAARLQPLGLVSIYADKPLRWFNHESAEYTGVLKAHGDFNITGKGVGIAIVDSGIDQLQGDFSNVAINVKIVGPGNLTDGTPAPQGYTYLDMTGLNSDTSSGHGTHVAGSAAGQGTMSNGYLAGMAPGATLIGVSTGEAIAVLFSLEAYDYLLQPSVRQTYNLRVINNSYGDSAAVGFVPNDPTNIATKTAHDLGVWSLFAAGNDGAVTDDGSKSDMTSYAASPCVMSVAAGSAAQNITDVNPNDYSPAFVGTFDPSTFPTPPLPPQGTLTDFSSRGKAGDVYDHPDIVAPGYFIASAYNNTNGTIYYIGADATPYVDSSNPDWSPAWAASYFRISGTSQATPMIAGILALLLEANPVVDWDAAQDALYSTAHPVNDTAGAATAPWQTGAGFVDAYAAVQTVLATAGGRYDLVTDKIADLSGSVGASVSAPEVGSLQSSSAQSQFDLPAGADYTNLHVDISWTLPADDMDIVVLGPDGSTVGSSANSPPSFESVDVPDPKPGTYTVIVNGYLNGPENYTGTASATHKVPHAG